MTKAEVDRFRAALIVRVADLERITHHRYATTVERSTDRLDETQAASQHKLEVCNLDREFNQLRNALAGERDMTNANCIRVLSIDDHPVFRAGVGTVIKRQADMSLAGTASNGREGIEAFRALRPDITLMDTRLPDLNGLDVLIAIRSEFPDARVIVLTTFEGDMDVQRALKSGARGYLLKSMRAEQMLDTIRRVHAGKKCVPAEIASGLAEHVGDEALSNREVEVLQQVAAGHRNRDIAAKLFIAEETVKVHIKHIMSKLAASDRTQSVTIAVRRGIIQL